jgi:hypothetical protein
MAFPPPPGSFEIDFHGIDLIRGRDCVIFSKGPAHNVAVDQSLISGGWPGGQGAQWVAAATDEPTVTYSSGLFGGFLIWGSDESADQYTASTGNQLVYGHAVLMTGRAVISTSSYERYTYASRTGGGPLVPLVYQPHQLLYFSLRGLWTNEDEMTLSGSALAPAVHTGWVCQLPKPINEFFLGIQTRL